MNIFMNKSRGPGDDQAGSFLALKRENDVNNAAFDIKFELTP